MTGGDTEKVWPTNVQVPGSYQILDLFGRHSLTNDVVLCSVFRKFSSVEAGNLPLRDALNQTFCANATDGLWGIPLFSYPFQGEWMWRVEPDLDTTADRIWRRTGFYYVNDTAYPVEDLPSECSSRDRVRGLLALSYNSCRTSFKLFHAGHKCSLGRNLGALTRAAFSRPVVDLSFDDFALPLPLYSTGSISAKVQRGIDSVSQGGGRYRFTKQMAAV